MTAATPSDPRRHPFLTRPNRTLLALSFPVLVSLIAEPLTGLADTAFVARLGASPLAALGVGTVVLSGLFWIFNFLGIGAQTSVARASGEGRDERAREAAGMALALAAGCGLALALGGWLATETLARRMGAEGEVLRGATVYMDLRWIGAPAVLLTLVAFGALRGLQDMRTPLRVAVGTNALNIVLDAVLIFGLGPVPAFGIAGAGAATSLSQWLGAVWALAAVARRIGRPRRLRGRDARELLGAGGHLFVRTGLLTLFLVMATRAATRIGAESGAAHQAVRQVWVFTALVLDAYAAVAQSLVGYFLGAGRVEVARRVAGLACLWSLGTGVGLGALMALLEAPLRLLLVPPAARAVFHPAWLVAAASQPINALSFATDGIHWGAADWRWLRDAMVLATAAGLTGLWLLDEGAAGALTGVWLVTAVWISARALLGLLRIWPGLGAAPLALPVDTREAAGYPHGK